MIDSPQSILYQSGNNFFDLVEILWECHLPNKNNILKSNLLF